MKRVLVTGGAGFVGSHLCERLLKEGNEVISLDNYFTGNKRNIVHLMDKKLSEWSSIHKPGIYCSKEGGGMLSPDVLDALKALGYVR